MATWPMGRTVLYFGIVLLAVPPALGQERSTPTVEQQRLAEEAMSLSASVIDAMAVEDNIIYVGWQCIVPARGRSGVQAVDVKDPVSPRLVHSLASKRSPAALAVRDGLLYVAWRPEQSGGPDLPQLVDQLRKGATPQSLMAANIKGDNDETEIYDVRDSSNPKSVSGFPDAKYVECLAVAGKHAFMSQRTSASPGTTLLVYDIQDPSKPSLVGQLPIEGWTHDIKVRGNLAYLASDGLKIVDVSNPASPKLAGSYDSHGESWGVSLVNDRAYVPIEYFRRYLGRASIFDISNPAAPTLLDRFATAKGAWNVETSNKVVYITDQEAVKCYDSAKNCRRLGSYTPREGAGKLLAARNRLYVADRYGFQILDITDPGKPRLLGQYDIISERERTEAMEKAKAAFGKPPKSAEASN